MNHGFRNCHLWQNIYANKLYDIRHTGSSGYFLCPGCRSAVDIIPTYRSELSSPHTVTFKRKCGHSNSITGCNFLNTTSALSITVNYHIADFARKGQIKRLCVGCIQNTIDHYRCLLNRLRIDSLYAGRTEQTC